jgi:hypothetical protein
VISPALASSTSFLNVTATLNLPSNITTIASVCLPGGGGQILSQFGSTVSGINTQIGNVQTMMSNLQTYGSFDTTTFNNSIANVSTMITDFNSAILNDLVANPTSLLCSRIWQIEPILPALPILYS